MNFVVFCTSKESRNKMNQSSNYIPSSIIDLILEIARNYDEEITKEELVYNMMVMQAENLAPNQIVLFLDEQNQQQQQLKKRLLESGFIDILINFTPSGLEALNLPGDTICFLDYEKKEKTNKDNVLVLNAYFAYQPFNIKLRQLTSEQVKNLASIVNLYHRQDFKYLAWVDTYITRIFQLIQNKPYELSGFVEAVKDILSVSHDLNKQLYRLNLDKKSQAIAFKEQLSHLSTEANFFQKVLIENTENSLTALENQLDFYESKVVQLTENHRFSEEVWQGLEDEEKAAIIQLQNEIAMVFLKFSNFAQRLADTTLEITRLCRNLINFIELNLLNSEELEWDNNRVEKSLERLHADKEDKRMRLEEIMYSFEMMNWLIKRFPQAEFRNLRGFSKITTCEQLIQNLEEQLETTSEH